MTTYLRGPALTAACLYAVLLLLAAASWRQLIGSQQNTYITNRTVTSLCGHQQTIFRSVAHVGRSCAKQQASIVVVVTSKDSSRDRRTWLREQFKRNVDLLRKRDAAAAAGVIMKFAVGSQGM